MGNKGHAVAAIIEQVLARPAACHRERVLIIEDHALLAQALALVLSGDERDVQVADLNRTGGLLVQAGNFRPDLVLLDLDLGREDGLELVSDLVAMGSTVLVMTGCAEESRLAAAVSLGAIGWVSKSEPFERLLEASEAAMRRRQFFSSLHHQQLVELGRRWLDRNREVASSIDRLTRREREILAAIRSGRTAQEIAEQLFVSVGTVRTHIQSVLLKLGVTSQLAAVAKTSDLAPPALARLETGVTSPSALEPAVTSRESP